MSRIGTLQRNLQFFAILVIFAVFVFFAVSLRALNEPIRFSPSIFVDVLAEFNPGHISIIIVFVKECL